MSDYSSIIAGDALTWLRSLPADYAQCCITSPPYYAQRDYHMSGQIGLEVDVKTYIDKLTLIFSELRRVLKKDGTLWLNIGDTYRKKNLILIPARVALALQNDGWYLRSDIIWSKPCHMPESVKDRPTSSYEHVFLLSKSKKYNYNIIRTPIVGKRFRLRTDFGRVPGRHRYGKDIVLHPDGKNLRNVWTINPKPSGVLHLATMPLELVERCMLSGSNTGDLILDPFCGSGSTGVVAKKLGRQFHGCDLNPQYVAMALERIETCHTK